MVGSTTQVASIMEKLLMPGSFKVVSISTFLEIFLSEELLALVANPIHLWARRAQAGMFLQLHSFFFFFSESGRL